jgi:hypothetical protein
MKCTACVEAGVCGFHTEVTADSSDDQIVTLSIETECEKIGRLAQALHPMQIDAYDEIGAGFDGVVMTAVRQHLSGCCAGCAVPAGIFKALQVAGGVALPREVRITLAKD